VFFERELRTSKMEAAAGFSLAALPISIRNGRFRSPDLNINEQNLSVFAS